MKQSSRRIPSPGTLLAALLFGLFVLMGAGTQTAQALPAPDRANAVPATLPLLHLAASRGAFDAAFTELFYGTWAVGSDRNCGVPRKTYTVEISSGQIIWRDGTGSIDVENIRDARFGGPFGLETVETVTLVSHHDGGRRENTGKVWHYRILSANRLSVSTSTTHFLLVRCW